jgi:hypothetical protein
MPIVKKETFLDLFAFQFSRTVKLNLGKNCVENGKFIECITKKLTLWANI